MLIRTDRKSAPAEQDGDELGLPIPAQIISNSEYVPIPQTPRQRRTEKLVREMTEERARKLGWSRRRFLSSSAGMATALMALNLVNGCGDDGEGGGFAVDDCATRDPAAARERLAQEYFIMDVQTHHVDLEGAPRLNPALGEVFRTFRFCAPAAVAPDQMCTRGALQELSLANYLKEMFLDSETTIAMMSGIPAPSAGAQALSNEAMAHTRDVADRLGASQRALTQGMLTPNFPPTNDSGTLISDMEHLVRDLGARALKTYPGAGGSGLWGNAPAWWLDDEAVAYPMYAEAERLGLNIVNVHKGFTLGIFDPEHIHPRDVPKAVRDWPQMNFVIYHSAGEFLDELARIKREELPDRTNVYAELGSIFAQAVIQGPIQVGHLLGKLLNSFGPNHILWGTDSIWWGSPQWQINALKSFVMPQQLIDQFGYPQVTPEIKAKIFGLNAARIYGVDADAVRCTLPHDLIEQAKVAYEDDGLREPSLRTYGPKTRREFLQLAFGHGHNPLA